MNAGDAEAMRRLASRLDEAADRLDACRSVLGAVGLLDDGRSCVAPADRFGPVLAATAAWASVYAGDIRRRASILDEAGTPEPGREWLWALQMGRVMAPLAPDADEARRAELASRFEQSGYDADPGLMEHSRRVSRHGLAALRDSVVGPLRGVVQVAGAVVHAPMAPVRVARAAVTGGPGAAIDEAERSADEQMRLGFGAVVGVVASVRQSVAMTPVVQAGVFAVRTERDGFWRAMEDNAADSAAAVSGELLSVVPGGEEAVGARALATSQLRSPSTAAAALGGIGALGDGNTWKATANDREILELAVPVPGTDEQVAVDYNNGDFLVSRPGRDGTPVVERHRWSRLGGRRRAALRAHGLVDGDGRPFGDHPARR